MALDNLGRWRGEIKGLKKGGQDIDLEISLSKLDDADTVVIVRDITSRKKADAEIKKSRDQLEKRVEERTNHLMAINRELESFCYSVSHDLRAPLRGIDGFSQALIEDFGDKLDDKGRGYLERVRVTRGDLNREQVNISELATEISDELKQRDKERQVDFKIQPGLTVNGDETMLRLMLDNLLGNAWKFTAKTPHAQIELGQSTEPDARTFYIKDNGAGFDMSYVDKLFSPFQRLHAANEFEGSGIGLAEKSGLSRK